MIPVLRAVLPSEEKISPLIKDIDINVKYTNFGPLSVHLTSLISNSYGLPNDCTLVTASGTIGLQACILYYVSQQDDLPLQVATPAWTFSATVQDVDSDLTKDTIDVNVTSTMPSDDQSIMEFRVRAKKN